MKAYEQLENKGDFTASDLVPFLKYKENFEIQCGFYYVAETVSRGTRDIYTQKDIDQF